MVSLYLGFDNILARDASDKDSSLLGQELTFGLFQSLFFVVLHYNKNYAVSPNKKSE
jgi:hypothetical protein